MKKFLAAGAAFAAGALLSGTPLLAQMRSNPPQDNPAASSSDPAAAARYGNPASPMSSTTSQLSSSDESFLRKAAAGGAAEVELGNLAKDKATDPDVKQFAEKMVTDHTKANDELKRLAEKKGVAISDMPDSKSKREMDRLSKLSGADFDKAYAKLMVSDHEKDVSEFQKESKDARDPEVRDFASRTLPTLQDHLRMAQEDNSKVAKSEKTS